MKQYKAIADYYDAEYAGLPMLDQDVPFFLSHLPKRRQNVLELAAGTARAAIPIAQSGHRVVAVDYAADMLAIAEQKRDSVGLTNRELTLLHRDVLKLNLNEKFDHVCIFFNTFYNFTTLDEQDRFLQVARRHLKPTGKLWMDIYNPDLELLSKKHLQQIDPAIFYVPSLDRSVQRDTELVQDHANQVQHVTFHYRWFDADAVEQHEQVKFNLTWLMPRELQLLLERNGFQITRLYGDYDGSAMTGDSPRIISVSRLRR
ncbi:MAG TPA: class I SAM-dependent methyltransferase [Tepidisphaeraceae bacterium]|jgi:ubiquinone/menaquinone biosynthesis C-methylase UbiE|nr:class I SAM-dependent methyltransferase [Tepidisphaeraceae bacterium]